MKTNHRFAATRLFNAALLASVLMALPVQSHAVTDALVFVADSNWDTDTDAEIHLMRPDGSDHRRIVTQYPVSSASIDPTGNWLVYTTPRRKELRLAHVSGRRERVLRQLRHITGRNGPGLVSWSPDGRRIVYTRPYSQNNIGVEVFDTRTRRFIYRTLFAPERQAGVQVEIQRLLWSPDSRHFAIVAVRKDVPTGVIRFDYRHTIVVSPSTGRRVLDINSRESIAPDVFAFASNSSLLAHIESRLSRVDFRTQREQEIVDLWVAFEPHNIAVSPNGRNLLIDADQIGGVTRRRWNDLRGTPKLSEFRRNFAFADTRRLTATFVTPLQDYSDFFGSSFNDAERLPNFEWRSVRSSTLFRRATCWGWVVTQRGTSGDDRINGSNGPDVIAAGTGNDVIVSGGGDDVICGGGGNDIVISGAGDDIVWGDVEINDQNLSDVQAAGNDRIQGGGGIDTLYGNNGNDQLNAGSGDDFLSGGDGDDVLDGAAGFDVLDGGDGTDACVNYVSERRCE